jgi:putative membrane protein
MLRPQIATKDSSMLTFALVLVAVMALLHVYILVLEMFLWTTRRGRKAFGTTAEFAEASKVLAANQGLYNGFLAAGLVWALITGGWEGYRIAMFFLGCILVAGIYGGASANRRILFIQALPALVTMLVLSVAMLSNVGIAGTGNLDH